MLHRGQLDPIERVYRLASRRGLGEAARCAKCRIVGFFAIFAHTLDLQPELSGSGMVSRSLPGVGQHP
jgi:hypothetical protein